MTTDDRDTESQNPSKSFKVGEVDRLSGFFTPVWESKRRLRADSPIPSSSAAASTPSSARGSDKNSRPSTPPSAPPLRRGGEDQPVVNAPGVAAKVDSLPPGRASRPPPRPSAAQRTATSKGVTSSAEPTPADVVTAPAMAAIETPPAVLAPLGVKATVQRENGLATPQRSAADAVAQDGLAAPGDEVAPAPLPVEVEERGMSAAGTAPDAFAGTALTTGVAVSVRPVIPMPNTPGRAAARPSKPPSSSPNAAAIALKQPSLGHGSKDERARDSGESEAAPLLLRRPARAEMPRAARAGNAGGASHEKLERKLPTDSVETFPRHRETESEREALQAAAARAAATAADPYPSHVLRTLRRTIHLSTTLPEAVRQMVDKYRY